MLVCLVLNHEPPYNVRVGRPAYNDPSSPAGMSDNAKLEAYILQNRMAGVFPEDVDIVIADDSLVPSDHDCDNLCAFFDAWVLDGTGSVVVDMVRARHIQMDKIRVARDKALAALDVEWMIAQEREDKIGIGRVRDAKQSLRDIPETFDLGLYHTPEALKLAWPEALKR